MNLKKCPIANNDCFPKCLNFCSKDSLCLGDFPLKCDKMPYNPKELEILKVESLINYLKKKEEVKL